ncbi:MAG: metallopeptidase TldD-related protein [Bdellovibrionota bacterium]
MKSFFYDIADKLFKNLQGDEWGELYLSSENTDFVRINQSQIRQPGHVTQHFLTLRLGNDQKKISSTFTIAGNLAEDLKKAVHELSTLRHEMPQAPNDPYLVKIAQSTQIETESKNELPSHEQALDALLSRAKKIDLVGLYTSGDLYRGFASSFGQRNWFSTRSFQLDWSLFHRADNALKSSFMGDRWEEQKFDHKWQHDIEQFQILGKTRKSLAPGNYRVYLSPSAMDEIVKLLSWNAFSLKALRNKSSSFLKLSADEEHMSTDLTVLENISLGISPTFNSHGDLKPSRVPLIEKGQYTNSLISSRSSKEFDIEGNAAEDHEQPTSLELAAGKLDQHKATQELHTGIFVNNLWYMNYSDRMSCRTTGMTRFATFWVENGKISHPIQVLRFDESLFRALGSNLESLTSEREMILSSDTYGERKTTCALLPGALINNFNFCQ